MSKFADNLRLTTDLLAGLNRDLQWVQSIAPTALANQATPSGIIEGIDRVLANCRRTMAGLDRIVDTVRDEYERRGYPLPADHQLN